jgi:acid phosphatase (class A)
MEGPSQLNPRRIILAMVPHSVIGRARSARNRWRLSQARRFIRPEQIDVRSLLPNPPAINSPELEADLLEVHRLHQTRTPTEIEQTTRESIVSPELFAQILGPQFNVQTLPRTFSFLHQLMLADGSIVEPIKYFFARKRPYEIDPRLNPNVPLEKTPSYPSGHAVRLLILASTLSQIFPEHEESLHDLGAAIPARRVKSALHFPTDIEAGNLLGTHIYNQITRTHAFLIHLAKARRECRALAQ